MAHEQSIQAVQALGDSLRSARKALGLTQSQLALASGVGTRFIVELEAGKPTLRIESVLRVVQSLGGVLTVTDLPQKGNYGTTAP
jgi:HTH-type transcriptional regulator / antitoxin HipB